MSWGSASPKASSFVGRVFDPEDAQSKMCDKLPSMWDALTFFYTSAIIILAAVFLFVLVGDLRPPPRLATLFKSAIVVVAVAIAATIANHLLPGGLLAAIAQVTGMAS